MGQRLADRQPVLPIVGEGDGRRTTEFDSRRKFRPQVYWYLSFRCNLSCAHCSVQASPWVDTAADLTTSEALRVVDQLVGLNASSVVLSGGEALIRKDILQILEALGERGVHCALETNGTTIPRRFPELARRLQDQDLLGITVSLDGATAQAHDRLRGSGAFRRTVGNLRRLAREGVRLNVQCVVNRSNLETIPQLYDLATELWPSLESLVFSLLNPVGRGEGLIADLGIGLRELSRILALVAEHKGRYAGRTILKTPPAAVPPEYLKLVFSDPQVKSTSTCQFPLLGVLPNGEVTICALSRREEELSFGNVRDSSLEAMWQRSRMDLLRRRYLAADLDGICGDCVWKYSCKGACRAWAYQEGGAFSEAFPLCAALAEAGEFPRVYRISAQRSAFERRMVTAGDPALVVETPVGG